MTPARREPTLLTLSCNLGYNYDPLTTFGEMKHQYYNIYMYIYIFINHIWLYNVVLPGRPWSWYKSVHDLPRLWTIYLWLGSHVSMNATLNSPWWRAKLHHLVTWCCQAQPDSPSTVATCGDINCYQLLSVAPDCSNQTWKIPENPTFYGHFHSPRKWPEGICRGHLSQITKWPFVRPTRNDNFVKHKNTEEHNLSG